MKKISFLGIIVFMGLFLGKDLSAQETPWQSHENAIQTRLMAAGQDEAGRFIFAWEAKLAPGWKTYWRTPGEAGLPVLLFNGEKAIDIAYPWPERFTLFDLETLGYSKQVILPFYLDYDGVSAVSIRADFMICKDICVPLRADYHMDASEIGAAGFVQEARVQPWLARVPARTGDAGAGLTIETARVTGVKGAQRLIVEVGANSPLDRADILAELIEARLGVMFMAPEKRLLGDGTRARFILATASQKQQDLHGQKIRLSFKDSEGRAIERVLDLP